MARTWKVGNIDRDGKPEFHLETSNPVSDSDLFVLFSALKGYYGVPFIKGGVEQEDEGMATTLVIAFENSNFQDDLLKKQLDTLSVTPRWYPDKYVFGTISNWYSYDSGFNKPSSVIKTLSRRQKLFFEIPDYDLIKNFNPQILIERYNGSNSRGDGGKKSGGAYRIAPRKSLIPLTSTIMEVDFIQEEYFRLTSKTRVRAKTYKRTSKGGSAHVYFQFRIQVNVNGKTFISIPVTRLMLQATYGQGSEIKSVEVTEMFSKATTDLDARILEVEQLNLRLDESVSDVERDEIKKQISKASSDLDDAKDLVSFLNDLSENIAVPGGPSNPQFDPSCFAISYRIT